eukprot:7548760-Pyramimonas_sp.AAC.1
MIGASAGWPVSGCARESEPSARAPAASDWGAVRRAPAARARQAAGPLGVERSRALPASQPLAQDVGAEPGREIVGELARSEMHQVS